MAVLISCFEIDFLVYLILKYIRMKNAPPYHVLIIDDNPEFVKNFKNLILGVGGSVIGSI
jgi:hypothetical protein